MGRRCIFLLTDFGIQDYYVSAMKSVILRINPHVSIIDVTHNISPWNILEGAFILWQLIPYTPKDSILVGVVDPGVGSSRKEIVIETSSGRYLVGPDNGLLYPAAYRDGISNIWVVKRDRFNNLSSTFHGRDIFVPIAAYLSKNTPITEYCYKIDVAQIVHLDLFNFSVENKTIKGLVLHIDRFGNIITNLDCSVFYKIFKNNSEVQCIIGSTVRHAKLVNVFSDLDVGELGLLCGSSGLIELVSNRFRANTLFDDICPGKPIIVKPFS